MVGPAYHAVCSYGDVTSTAATNCSMARYNNDATAGCITAALFEGHSSESLLEKLPYKEPNIMEGVHESW